jgi:hypothetical protein
MLAWLGVALTGAAHAEGVGATPTVDQILSHYLEARGGATAWSKVAALGWIGHIESGAAGSQKVPFMLLFQRPGSTRLEVTAQNQHSMRIFDGSRGWRSTPGGETGTIVNDYSPEEISAARDSGGLDGPLVNPASKGIRVTLDRLEKIENVDAWRLNVTLPSGQVQTHWIDATTYLELRYDRASRNAMGMAEQVAVYLRNYEEVAGLKMPLLIETRAQGGAVSDRMIIEKVAINPTLQANTFARPDLPTAKHGGVMVNITGSGAAAGARR